MTHGKLLIAVGVVLVVAVGVAVVILKRPSDCDTVRSMITHNNEFNEHVESATSRGVQTTLDEYRDWASQLDQLSDQIRDPALGEHAHALADLAEQAAAATAKFLDDGGQSADQASPPPQYVQDYSRIGKEFDATLSTLDQSCPA